MKVNPLTLRFATFSTVGAAGFLVQLGALWLLTDRAGVHYLASALAATELAVLLNFAGHESWTWSDRPAGARQALWRLCRFHGTNGCISLAGALLIMPLLVETAALHYTVANVLTVGVCALANFAAADRIVFTPALGAAFAFVASGLAGPAARPAEAAELRAATVEAFDKYVRITEERMKREIEGRIRFLWIDRLEEVDRRQAHTALRRGETVVDRLKTHDADREIDVPGGMIHHWVGTTFVPHGTIDDAIALMQRYERYPEVYAPTVRRSRIVSRQGDRFDVSMQFSMKKVITAVLNVDTKVQYRRLGEARAHVRSYSTRIAQVENAGAANETEAPVGRDSGYLWRFNNYCSLEQRSEGTFIQCESLSLSRTVPSGLGWLVGPFVTSIPRESLEFTLSRMRSSLAAGR